ncbi:hypothetical protein [Aeromicrobium sp. CTD01-1L150]|uniref:hypothetical protein n=1 Tax=Aeromicrobium sp. CTD01-1L150 TaxID=3341830 RepID=UPI0035BFC5B4
MSDFTVVPNASAQKATDTLAALLSRHAHMRSVDSVMGASRRRFALRIIDVLPDHLAAVREDPDATPGQWRPTALFDLLAAAESDAEVEFAKSVGRLLAAFEMQRLSDRHFPAPGA